MFGQDAVYLSGRPSRVSK